MEAKGRIDWTVRLLAENFKGPNIDLSHKPHMWIRMRTKHQSWRVGYLERSSLRSGWRPTEKWCVTQLCFGKYWAFLLCIGNIQEMESQATEDCQPQVIWREAEVKNNKTYPATKHIFVLSGGNWQGILVCLPKGDSRWGWKRRIISEPTQIGSGPVVIVPWYMQLCL